MKFNGLLLLAAAARIYRTACSQHSSLLYPSNLPQTKSVILSHTTHTSEPNCQLPRCCVPFHCHNALFSRFSLGACFSRANFIPTMRFARSPGRPVATPCRRRAIRIVSTNAPRSLAKKDEIYRRGKRGHPGFVKREMHYSR